MQGVVRFWVERGVDGFRIDAIDRLMKDPELRDDPPLERALRPVAAGARARPGLSHSRNWHEIGKALGAIREAAGDALLVGEVYLPARRHAPYLEHLDRAFVFELLQSPWEPEALRARPTLEAGSAAAGAAWVLSNHDFGRARLARRARTSAPAAMLLLTLPGTAFVYQGDEIGLANGPGRDPPYDRFGRDHFATRCSGTPRRAAASRPGGPGCRSSTRRSATSPPRQRDGARRSRSGSS